METDLEQLREKVREWLRSHGIIDFHIPSASSFGKGNAAMGSCLKCGSSGTYAHDRRQPDPPAEPPTDKFGRCKACGLKDWHSEGCPAVQPAMPTAPQSDEEYFRTRYLNGPFPEAAPSPHTHPPGFPSAICTECAPQKLAPQGADSEREPLWTSYWREKHDCLPPNQLTDLQAIAFAGYCAASLEKRLVLLEDELPRLRQQLAQSQARVEELEDAYFQDEGIAADGEIRPLVRKLLERVARCREALRQIEYIASENGHGPCRSGGIDAEGVCANACICEWAAEIRRIIATLAEDGQPKEAK